MLHLFDTAKGGVVAFEPREPGKVSMYVCGPTVYGPPHLGHGRFSLVFDVLRRYLEWSGNEVTYVSNITDVDDNIINRARSEGRSEAEVAAEYEAVWWEAMDAIGVQRPTLDPHATAYVDHMVELVARLVDFGVAYETSDGVYFQAERIEDYGLLARQSLDSLRAGARVESSDEKRSPVDFALWKKATDDAVSWPSPWGNGRPGWHTECVVMALDLLGEGFDIHGGGQDLAFPHHENERAQSAADGRSFARYWIHNGFVEVDGEKMSKSLGNFTNLMDLIDRADPRAYRLLVLRSHYRSPIEVNEASVADAVAALERLDAFARRTRDLVGAPDPAAVDAFREAMDRRSRHARGHRAALRSRAAGELAPRPGRRGRGGAPCRRRPGDQRRGGATAAGRRRRGAARGRRAGPAPGRRPGREGLGHGRRPARRAPGAGLEGRGRRRRHRGQAGLAA